LRSAVAAHKNILVAGGTSSGKTTLTNALLAEVAKTSDRVVLIEDTRELQCQAPNLVALRTKDGVVSLSDLVRSSLRLRPDRIPIIAFKDRTYRFRHILVLLSDQPRALFHNRYIRCQPSINLQKFLGGSECLDSKARLLCSG
jgi:Type II/IV secretion system protein